LQKCEFAIALAVEVVDVAFEIAFAVADVISRVSNEYLYVDYSLNYLIVSTFQLIGFLLHCTWEMMKNIIN
jgi:hypothetical protein